MKTDKNNRLGLVHPGLQAESSAERSRPQEALFKTPLPPAIDAIDRSKKSVHSQLNWLNPNYRMLADRRLKAAKQSLLPYIVARQNINGSPVHNDGSVAYHGIQMGTKSEKMFTPDGHRWSVDVSKTQFFYIWPEQNELSPIGTMDELYRKGLDTSDIDNILWINNFHSEELIDDPDDPPPYFEPIYQALSRATLHLLFSSGDIFPKQPRIAESILTPLDSQQRRSAMADLMALSAGSNKPTLLSIALKMGFDPNQKSTMLEATPLEHATNKGCTEAVKLLWPLRNK